MITKKKKKKKNTISLNYVRPFNKKKNLLFDKCSTLWEGVNEIQLDLLQGFFPQKVQPEGER